MTPPYRPPPPDEPGLVHARDRTPDEMARTLERVRSVARLMDDAVRIPGTNIGIGVDSVIGLFPGIGDLAGAAASAYVVLAAARLGVPRAVLLRMLVNVGTDALVGAVPVLGDLFDVAFKANRRNTVLLEEALAVPDRTRRASTAVVVAVVVGVLAVGVAGIALAIVLARALVGLLGL